MKKVLIFLFTAIFLCINSVYAEKIPTAGDNVSHFSVGRKYKDANWKTINKMKTQAKNLSDEEKGVIRKYIFGAVRGEDTYLLINCYLRDTLEYYIPQKEITKPLKCRLEFYANSLSIPVTKIKLPKNMILYRGIDEKGMRILFANKKINNLINGAVSESNAEALKKHLAGTTFTEKGFMSTSYDKSAAKQTKFMFEVYAPKNLQAVLLEDLGKKQEKEVLINKNSNWEIVNIRTDINKKTKKSYYLITIKYSL